MMMSGQHIFRQKAIQHYRQSRERDILPRIVAPRIFLFLWILLGLLFASVVLTWLEQVPTTVEGSGIVLEDPRGTAGANDGSNAVVFLPANALNRIHSGQAVQTQAGLQNLSNAVVSMVEPGVTSPNEIKRRYGQAVAGPTVVAIITFKPVIHTQEYAGTLIHAQVQIGTQRMLSLFPGVGPWIG